MAWVTKDSTETYNQTPEPPREYTKKEKAANWWHYHWMAVVVAVLVVVFGVWIIKDTVFQTRPDVQVAYVGTSDLPTDTVTALQDALTPFCSDLNGDGKVVVQVDSYTVDFDAANESTDAYYQMAGVTRLSAELSSGGKTYIFLLEDPEGFETQTGALQYLDGTVPDDPETTDADWREMVYRWTDCPVLTGLDLGGPDHGPHPAQRQPCREILRTQIITRLRVFQVQRQHGPDMVAGVPLGGPAQRQPQKMPQLRVILAQYGRRQHRTLSVGPVACGAQTCGQRVLGVERQQRGGGL